MTFEEWFSTIDFKTKRNFMEMSVFAFKKIAKLAWDKSREETLKEVEENIKKGFDSLLEI